MKDLYLDVEVDEGADFSAAWLEVLLSFIDTTEREMEERFVTVQPEGFSHSLQDLNYKIHTLKSGGRTSVCVWYVLIQNHFTELHTNPEQSDKNRETWTVSMSAKHSVSECSSALALICTSSCSSVEAESTLDICLVNLIWRGTLCTGSSAECDELPNRIRQSERADTVEAGAIQNAAVFLWYNDC